jgi:transmembrane sensor
VKNYNLMGADELSQDSYFRKWALGELSVTDTFWENWQKLNPDHALLAKEAKSLVISLQAVDTTYFSSKEISEGIRQILEDTYASPVKVKLWNSGWLRIAASLLLLCGIAWLIPNNKLSQKITQEFTAIDKKKTIHSNKGTATSAFTLSDGSKITLGPHSELQYSPDFGNSKREVYLSGEAFFEVAKDAERPFWVVTGKLVTKVIGTSFNVKAYDAENDISVSVTTGKVTVARQNSANTKEQEHALSTEIVLLPNQKAVFNKEQQLLVKTLVDKPIQINKISLDTDFLFEETKIADVYAVLEKYYGVDITFDPELMAYCTITADLREESLYEKLDLICEIIQAKYKITDGQIVIYGLGCRKH